MRRLLVSLMPMNDCHSSVTAAGAAKSISPALAIALLTPCRARQQRVTSYAPTEIIAQ